MEHGEFEEVQMMNVNHVACCPICGVYANRVYTVPALTGDLPTIKKIEYKEED